MNNFKLIPEIQMSDACLVEIQKIKATLKTYNEEFEQQINQIFDQFEIMHNDLRTRMRGAMQQSHEAPKEATEAKEMGKVRVGRILHSHEKGKKLYAVTDGFTNIIVTSHNNSKLGHSLSPYKLADHKGRLMENLWQFAKIYVQVTEQHQKEWSHDAEVHALKYKKGHELDINNITPDYWKWRSKGMNHKHPVRYPNGFNGKAKCICALWPETTDISTSLDHVEDEYAPMEQLDYITARKRIYIPLYIQLAKQTEEFAELQSMLNRGENLQIMDVDGPDDTIYDDDCPFPYNTMVKGIHGVTSGVGSIEINEKNIQAVLNDPTQPFGHGYCLAVALLGKEEWLQ